MCKSDILIGKSAGLIAEVNVRAFSFVVDVSCADACQKQGIRGWELLAWASSAGEMLTDFIPKVAFYLVVLV